jgi:multidrug resistance efflux pump
LGYLIARGRSMNERALAQAQRQDQAFRHYVQDAAGNQPSAADEIAKLATLRDQGAISEQEFAHAKAKLLGTPSPGGAMHHRSSQRRRVDTCCGRVQRDVPSKRVARCGGTARDPDPRQRLHAALTPTSVGGSRNQS